MERHPHQPRARTPILALLAVLAAHCLAPPTHAQPPIELGEPLHFDRIGLRVQFPVGARVEGTNTTYRVLDESNRWLINMTTPETGDAAATVHEALDNGIKLIQGAFGVMDKDQKLVLSTQAEILERTDDLVIDGLDATRFYASVPSEKDKPRLIKGYTFFKPTPRRFLVYELICSEEVFNTIKPIYEIVVASSDFSGLDQAGARKHNAVRAGIALFTSLTEQDFLDTIPGGKTQWHRLYRPPIAGGKDTDAEELGYRGIRVWNGKRGEVDPQKPTSEWKAADQDQGYLVRVNVRLMFQGTPVDSVGTFFMTPDRNEETWILRTFAPDNTGERSLFAQEIGARVGDQLSVEIRRNAEQPRLVQPAIVNDGYATQVESILLPYLAVNKDIRTDLAFYTYDSRSERIGLRRDTVTFVPDQFRPTYTVETTYPGSTAPQTSRFDTDGELIQTTRENGTVWEPTPLDRIRALWKRARLPVGDTRD